MQPKAGASSQKAHLAWIAIAGMIVAGSFSIGLTEITGNEGKSVILRNDAAPMIVTTTTASALVSDELIQFFESFDANNDDALQFSEAESFFYWVEENVTYRSDDESILTIVPGVKSISGDGRDGIDYRQTPVETFKERAGDCEDMATLAIAFFKHFGIEAYLAGVNAKYPNQLDHAVAIVRMEDFADEPVSYMRLLGYSIDDGTIDVYGNSISAGTYLLLDNAYSDTFGYLSDGFEPDTFMAQCFIPLEKGYRNEWNAVVSRCLDS
jgi:hypothetical protein